MSVAPEDPPADSPASRYARSRSALGRFAASLPFALDPFQVAACQALEDGHTVLVAAPTGSGKTVVGEFAVDQALRSGTKCFYTTPIKALSNQKFAELRTRHGDANVGLLTGDNSVNSEAPIVVMTTEVLRNMVYAGSGTLDGLAYVVMDEVHYLADRMRGAVWEEVIIHLPERVQLACLSATVSNAEEFGAWLDDVRGNTVVVVEEHRPVPLWQHVMVDTRLHDLFVDDDHNKVNPELLRLARNENESRHLRDRRPGRGGRRPRSRHTPLRTEVVNTLHRAHLLPAIYFVFSRAGCDAAVEQCLSAGIRLTDPDERDEIRRRVLERTDLLPAEDLSVLGWYEWLDGLERGIASHHAGLLPVFKETVEELFADGLVKMVFATETLALGVNMPARSVVLEKLVKWNGDAHVEVTPGEYTQLTGRAGRRGIDVEGHAVVLWADGFDPRSVAGLASTRTYPLRSSFRPSYNMAVNLVGQVGRERSRTLLESSFAQFQADRGVGSLARQVRRNNEALAGYQDAMSCHLGDFAEYAELRRRLGELESTVAREAGLARKAAAEASLEKLRPGDIIRTSGGRRAGASVVLTSGRTNVHRDEPWRLTVLSGNAQVRRLTSADFTGSVDPLDRIKIPRTFSARDPQSRKDLANTLRMRVDLVDNGERDEFGARPGRRGEEVEEQISALRAAIRSHPCHGCAEREDHARWAERYARLARENDAVQERVNSRTTSVARQFDKVCAVLDSLGYLDGDSVTPDGKRLARLYSELDLLAAECLRQGVWNELAPAELAAAVSLLVFEPRERRGPEDPAPRLPPGAIRPAVEATQRLWVHLGQVESDHQVSFQREPDAGFAWVAYRWASGHRLEVVLRDTSLTAGDFVRWCKQLIDLLGQIADAAEGPLELTSRAAADAVRRGVVAWTGVT